MAEPGSRQHRDHNNIRHPLNVRLAQFRTFSFFLYNYQICLTDTRRTPCKTRSMDLSKVSRQEIEALLRLLAYLERKELALLMRERMEADQEGRLH